MHYVYILRSEHVPSRFYVWVDVRKQKTLPHDVLRHTFISMTVGAFRPVGDAALQAGNSEAVIRKHFLDLKRVEEADRFWRVVPEGGDAAGVGEEGWAVCGSQLDVKHCPGVTENLSSYRE